MDYDDVVERCTASVGPLVPLRTPTVMPERLSKVGGLVPVRSRRWIVAEVSDPEPGTPTMPLLLSTTSSGGSAIGAGPRGWGTKRRVHFTA